MIVRHDLYCRMCGTELLDQFVDAENLPKCGNCNARMRVSWSHGKPPGTDVLGSEVTSEILEDASGRPLTYTSSRERDAKMAAQGFVPAGDRVGGSPSIIRDDTDYWQDRPGSPEVERRGDVLE